MSATAISDILKRPAITLMVGMIQLPSDMKRYMRMDMPVKATVMEASTEVEPCLTVAMMGMDTTK